MSALSLSSFGRFSGHASLVLRLVIGFLFVAHGWGKLSGGPAMFAGLLDQLGVPAPTLMAWFVTLLELGGGILLIVGLLSRLVAALLTVNLVFAILLVKVDVGLISMKGAGAELDLAYIAGLLAILFLGPGRSSLDQAIGIEAGEGGTGARAGTVT